MTQQQEMEMKNQLYAQNIDKKIQENLQLQDKFSLNLDKVRELQVENNEMLMQQREIITGIDKKNAALMQLIKKTELTITRMNVRNYYNKVCKFIILGCLIFINFWMVFKKLFF